MTNTLPVMCQKAYAEAGELGLARLVADTDELYNGFKKQTFNLQKPEMFAVYEAKDYAQKVDFDSKYPDWRKRCGADVYESQSVSIRLENESNLLHLKRYKELLKGDVDRQIKISELINEYEPSEAVDVAKKFGGSVVYGHLFDRGNSEAGRPEHSIRRRVLPGEEEGFFSQEES